MIGGIGCLVIIIALFVGGGALVAKFAPQLKEFWQEAQSNPDKATAKLALKFIPGLQIIREDDANQAIVFKIGADGEELTMEYKDMKTSRKPVIKNSRGEVIDIEDLGKEPAADASPAPTSPPGLPAPQN
jgi:hypothetical protein